MAKKDPTDLSVEEKLKTLFQLQTALSAIDETKALRGDPMNRSTPGLPVHHHLPEFTQTHIH